jgi:hypothetical protein
MGVDWLKSEDGRKRIFDLLCRSGMPLEVQVAHQCRRFSGLHDGERQIRISTLRAVYGNMQSTKAAREVDQSIQFDRQVDLDDDIGVRLRLRLPIECKYRQGLQVFGFPRPRDERVAMLPVVSDFAGATVVNQLAYLEPPFVRNSRECAVALIESTSDGNRQHRVCDEQLIYKAGGSLYDFVRTVEGSAGLVVDDLVTRYGFIDQFKKFCGPPGDWFARFHQFVRTVPNDIIDRFTQEWLTENNSGQTMHLEASIHLPVICIDAPLFVVPSTRTGRMNRFLETDILVTGLRPQNWPGRMFYFLGRRRPEALAVVANIAGVPRLLEECLAWYFEMLDQLESTEPTVVKRALLEGLLFRSTAATNKKRRKRRPTFTRP